MVIPLLRLLWERESIGFRTTATVSQCSPWEHGMQARAKRKASDQGSAAPQESSAIDAAQQMDPIPRQVASLAVLPSAQARAHDFISRRS